jgi:O-antigen/teichoic acid export membrane protein
MEKISALIKNPTLQNISVVTLGNLLNSALGFVALVLIGRYLGPIDLGVFSVIFGFFSMLSKLGDIGGNATIVKYISQARVEKNIKREQEVVSFGLGITYLLILITILLIAPFYNWIAELLNVPQYANFVLISIFFSAGWVMFNTYNVFLQAIEKFRDYIAAYTVSNLFKLGGLVVLLSIGLLKLDLAIGIYLLSPVFGFFLGWYFFRQRVNYPLRPSLNYVIFKSMTPFIYFMGAASIVGAVNEQSGIFVSSILFNSQQTGLYAAATRLGMIFSLLVGSVGTVLIPRAAKYQDVEQLKIFARKTLYLGGLMFVAIIPVTLFPKIFLQLTVGREFDDAAGLLIIAALTGGVQILTGSFSAVFFALNKAQYFAVVAILTLFLELGLMFSLAPYWGIWAIGVAKLVSALTSLIVALVYYRLSIISQKKL